MNWEIEDCLIRLENQMYEIGGERKASNDHYTIAEYIIDIEKENKELRVSTPELLEALQSILHFIQEGGYGFEETCERVAKDAIAKVSGRTGSKP